jgi:hypothetical protein
VIILSSGVIFLSLLIVGLLLARLTPTARAETAQWRAEQRELELFARAAALRDELSARETAQRQARLAADAPRREKILVDLAKRHSQKGQ